MKFVRWLGAFGRGSSLAEAVTFETKKVSRQVAAEPLFRGRSLIPHAKIGLVIDESRSVFVRGWICDAWTIPNDSGVLRPRESPRKTGNVPFRDKDRFLAAFQRETRTDHGEAVFDSVVYNAVVVKSTATAHGLARAEKLAITLGLPLKRLR